MAGLGTKLFLQGDTLSADEVNGYFMSQVVTKFTTAAARDSAFGDGIPVSLGGSGKPVLSPGMFCFILFQADGTTELNTVQYYNGSSWQDADQFTVGDGSITTAKIADGAITSDKIAADTVVAADIAAGAVGTSELANDSVTTIKIANSNVTTAKIADSAITSAKIADGTITNDDINASAAIDKTKISGTAITAADTGTVTSTMIADDTIVNTDVSTAAAIDLNKLADATIDTKSTNYPLVLTDKNKFIKMDSASNRTIGVPLQSTVDFPVGSQIHLIRYGIGTLEVIGESGAVNIYATPGKFLRAQYSSATLLKCDTNTWLLTGDLSAS